MGQNEGGFFLWNLLKQYLSNSSIHGFKYLVEPGRHWTERLFWLIACTLSLWACGLMVISTIQFATARDVSITYRTDYLNYEAALPALHICIDSTERIKKLVKERNLDTNLFNFMDFGLRATRVPSEDQIEELFNLNQPKCEEVFGVCMWNSVEIDCCKLFLPFRSTIGQCLSFNSVHTANLDKDYAAELVMNHRQPEGRLTLLLNRTQYMNKMPPIYLLNRFAYPTSRTHSDKKIVLRAKDSKLAVIDVTAIPTLNQKEVIEMSMSIRGCRMSYEIDENLVITSYNYDGCLMESHMRTMYRMFGCISHIFPRITAMSICNGTQLKKAVQSAEIIKSISQADCLPDCEGIVYDFSLNTYKYKDLPTWALMQIEVNMLPGPSIQYERYATRSLLQVIISVGSVIGLFTGASLLSIVELFYWFVCRANS